MFFNHFWQFAVHNWKLGWIQQINEAEQEEKQIFKCSKHTFAAEKPMQKTWGLFFIINPNGYLKGVESHINIFCEQFEISGF